ncbi:MAG TPA: hypothetical protein VLF19_07610, partial [Methylomirabilota bacterium]|nr:hypothetical protein [Methylomirabilota bacterium]
MPDLLRTLLPITALVVLALLVVAAPGDAAVKPRVLLVVPYDAASLGGDGQWVGEGIAEIVRLGLAQHPAFVQLDTARLRQFGQPEIWGDDAVQQAARALRADAALFGRVVKSGTDYTIQPMLYDIKASGGDMLPLEPMTIPEADLMQRLPAVVVAYVRSMRIAPTDAELGRIEKAARPTRSLRAFELYARSQQALRRGGQEGNESAADLLS